MLLFRDIFMIIDRQTRGGLIPIEMLGWYVFEEIELSICVYEIGIVEGEDADYVAVGVVFGLHRNDSLEL